MLPALFYILIFILKKNKFLKNNPELNYESRFNRQ